MKRTCLNELQKAIYEEFTGEYNVYDAIPKDPLYPFLIIGRDSTIDRGTKTYFAEEVNAVLSFFSLYQGYKEVKTFADEVISRMSLAPLTMSNYEVYYRAIVLVDSFSGVNEDDREFRQVVLKYKFYVQDKGGN